MIQGEPEPLVVLLSAPTKSGKTYFIERYIETYGEYYDSIIIISASTQYNDDYQNLNQNQEKVFRFQPSRQVIEKILNLQESAALKAKENPEEYDVPHTMMVLDDVIDSGLIQFRGLIDRVAERGRHVNLTAFVCTQRLSAASRSIRINARLFLFFKPFAVSETEQFVERMVPRYVRRPFRRYMHQEIFKEKFVFLLYDHRDNDNVFYYGKTEDFMQGHMHRIDLDEIEQKYTK